MRIRQSDKQTTDIVAAPELWNSLLTEVASGTFTMQLSANAEDVPLYPGL